MKHAAVLTALVLASIAGIAVAQGNAPHHGFLDRLRAADTNADGMLSRDEAAALPRISANFDAIDTNHDNYITFDELRAFFKAHHAKRHGDFLKRLDTDGDGRISKAEAATAPRLAQHFDQIDANHDGFLTQEEIRAAHQAMRVAHWKRIDTDGDGKISLAEAQANAPRLAAHFDQVDANHDGFITPDELRAAFHAMHGNHGQ